MDLRYEHLYVGGERVWPSSSRVITLVNPSTEALLDSVPDALEADVAAARRAFDEPGGWASGVPEQRADVMEPCKWLEVHDGF
ncbi:hypothetical protein [Streptomyces scopuliridis]|uniref:hypothetical protein n=1 Tax=Streptomyces scopuliridis TaxID=452529 RepID=UPI00341F6759